MSYCKTQWNFSPSSHLDFQQHLIYLITNSFVEYSFSFGYDILIPVFPTKSLGSFIMFP